MLHINKVRSIAKGMGIKTSGLNKTQIIQTIQRQEGNFDCYATSAAVSCDQTGCLWREDCFKVALPAAK